VGGRLHPDGRAKSASGASSTSRRIEWSPDGPRFAYEPAIGLEVLIRTGVPVATLPSVTRP
jgi:hypothetical protein